MNRLAAVYTYLCAYWASQRDASSSLKSLRTLDNRSLVGGLAQSDVSSMQRGYSRSWLGIELSVFAYSNICWSCREAYHQRYR